MESNKVFFVTHVASGRISFVFKRRQARSCDIYILPETNTAPVNGWLEAYFPWDGLFSGFMLVFGRVEPIFKDDMYMICFPSSSKYLVNY